MIRNQTVAIDDARTKAIRHVAKLHLNIGAGGVVDPYSDHVQDALLSQRTYGTMVRYVAMQASKIADHTVADILRGAMNRDNYDATVELLS